MKKKGFTLVELIVTIVILAILILIAFAIYTNIEKSVLEGQYNNLVLDIETKAEEYASDIGSTDVIYINVEYLINHGYIQADDDNTIYDPRDNTSMNCYMIHIILEDGQYKAELQDKEENDDGTCNIGNIDTGQVDLLCNGTFCSNGWYADDVTLNISGLSEEELLNSTVEWTSLLGTYELQEAGTEKSIVVNPSLVLNTTYNVTITTADERYNISKNIRIDKEEPILISKELEVNYSSNQELSINASDLSGSGLAGYAITSGDCQNAQYINGNIPINQSGNIKICLKDNAGNISYEETKINRVIFDYNNTSSSNITQIPVYFLDDDVNYPLPEAIRNGYNFVQWEDNTGNRVYSFEELEDGDVVNASWQIVDVEIPVDKIDKDTVGVMIENKINMILVLDVSGSMRGSNLSNLKSVSKDLINSMSFKVGSTISIVEFESSASTLLERSTSASSAISRINSLSASGGTDFVDAMYETNDILRNNNFIKDETFVIFVSDGIDSGYSGEYAYQVQSQVNTVYAIGIGSDTNRSKLQMIASPGCYFNSNSGLDSLKEIFTKIQDEIREEVTIKSESGLIALPNLYVSSDYPFILNIGSGDMEFPTLNSISDILTTIGGTYYLDLEKVDNKYKLNGNVSQVSFTYYYS